MTKQLNTRIQLKHDFENNWCTASSMGFVPKSGEIIIYDQEADSDGNRLTIDNKFAEPEKIGRFTYYTYPRMKIGDGVHVVEELPFSGGMSQVFAAQDAAPSNTNLLWIDTTEVSGGLKYYNGVEWVTVPVRFA